MFHFAQKIWKEILLSIIRADSATLARHDGALHVRAKAHSNDKCKQQRDINSVFYMRFSPSI
jgi:hypothetical protein